MGAVIFNGKSYELPDSVVDQLKTGLITAIDSNMPSHSWLVDVGAERHDMIWTPGVPVTFIYSDPTTNAT